MTQVNFYIDYDFTSPMLVYDLTTGRSVQPSFSDYDFILTAPPNAVEVWLKSCFNEFKQ